MDPLEPVRLLQHGCVRFEFNDAVVVVDPYQIRHATHDADLIIITHAHADHYSPADIDKVRREDTCFVTTPEIAHKLAEAFNIDNMYLSEITYDAPTTLFECGAGVTPVVAENANHPVDAGFGVVLEFGDVRYYLSGDTDVLSDSVRCDVLFVCCDGIYNMPQYETRIPAEIRAMDKMPKLTVPYHYGEEGTQQNGAKLCAALTAAGIPCCEWEE